MKKILLFLIIIWITVFSLVIYLHLQKNNQFKIIFFDIGQGDSALIKFTNGQKMLVDCGPDKKVLAKLGKYLPFYDRTIDYLAISHFDLDHYGGCVDVLKRYTVKNIIYNGSEKITDKYWQTWDEFRIKEQSNEFIVWQTSTWKMGNSKIEFLWPLSSQLIGLDIDNENNKSIVFRLVNDNTSVLFTGDMEEKIENILMKTYCIPSSTSCPSLESKILKAGHHGSDSSSSKEFIEKVNPDKAIISVGKNNFGHPSLRILRIMERASLEVLRTDQLRDIMVMND